MTKLENKVLTDLYESVNGLYAFTFYSRYKIEPDEIFIFIKKYQEKGIIIYDNDKLILSDEGKKFILKKSFSVSPKGRFSNIPLEFKTEKININVPYLPNISDIPREILNPKEGGIETSI